MKAVAPLWGQMVWATQDRFPVVASEPWGRLERIAPGVWGLVSTPLEDRTTLCNGGIISGRERGSDCRGVCFNDGARWMTEQARRLTGRRPTHTVITHSPWRPHRWTQRDGRDTRVEVLGTGCG